VSGIVSTPDLEVGWEDGRRTRRRPIDSSSFPTRFWRSIINSSRDVVMTSMFALEPLHCPGPEGQPTFVMLSSGRGV
jgi:hypothetical protein